MTLFPLPGFMKPKGLGLCAQYQTVYNAMTNKPSTADALNQDTMLKALVDLGVYAKAEFLDMFSVHTNTGGEAQINWRNPGTFNPTLVNNPTFTAYEGFTGDNSATRCIRTNFIPSTNGILIGQDNICIIGGVGTDYAPGVAAGAVFGAQGPTGGYMRCSFHQADNNQYNILNCNIQSAVWIGVDGNRKHVALSRLLAASYDTYNNLLKQNCSKVSVAGLTNVEIYACAMNITGTITAANVTLRYLFLFSGLTEAEVTGVIGIMNTYLTNYGTNLYT